MKRFRYLQFLFCGIAVLFVTGCSGKTPTYPVKGTVSFEDGSPVMFGTIELLSTERPINARGTIDREGNFVLSTFKEGDGAVAGKHQCVITQMVVDYYGVQVEHDHGDLVAEKYSRYSTTDLEVVVETQANQVKLVVDKK